MDYIFIVLNHYNILVSLKTLLMVDYSRYLTVKLRVNHLIGETVKKST